MTKKQPKLVLRESCVRDVSAHWPPGRFLEMGAGTGHMTQFFLDQGYWGAASDLGESSRALMRRNLASAGERMTVFDASEELQPDSFDYLFAFEVLEHIDNDHAVLQDWVRYLRPGGRALFSVPAHARKFGRSDELVGHVRRYEKKDLESLLRGCGLENVGILNYGFPLTEVTRRISNRLVANDVTYDAMTAEERSIRSAQAQPQRIQKIVSMLNAGVFVPFCALQRLFYRRDWGDSYVVHAVKRAG